ncbi:MAG TPA: glycosyltransferase [Vicinamibacterales bacterium]|nr:glycosyltransferase [Vicinamibacterales bacterium]
MAKILFLTSRFPHPLNKGDKLRAFHQIRLLSARHEVHLATVDVRRQSEADRQAVLPYCTTLTELVLPVWQRVLGLPLAVVNGLPFQVQYFRSAALDRRVRALVRELRPDVVHCHLIRMAPYVHRAMAARTTLDYMDCFSIGALREAGWARWPKRALLRWEHHRLRRYERAVWSRFDAHCVISTEDRAQLAVEDPSSVQLVQNGVDREIFHPLQREVRYDVLFTGQMGYPPNIAAALYSAQEVLPRLRAFKPDANLLIAGISAPRQIHALQNGHVRVIEHFQHIREAFAMSRVLLAPMRISIGLQNKILQAMAMGIPVVTSAQGNAAIGGVHGEHLLVADTPADMAAAAYKLLSDAQLRARITAAAMALVAERFTWERVDAALERVLFPAPTRDRVEDAVVETHRLAREYVRQAV